EGVVQSRTSRSSAWLYDRWAKNSVLYEFIAVNRSEIIKRCRAKVATRSTPPPTEREIDHGVPIFLEQLVEALQPGPGTTSKIGRTALEHGHDLLLEGFTVS